MARIINIASGKGGVGKTTTAINLGIVLAKEFNKNVVLIDSNLTTAHVGLYLGVYDTPITLNSVIRGEASPEQAVYAHSSGLKIIPASLNIQDLEGVDDTAFVNFIKGLAKNFDIVLLDSAPGLGREALMSLKACDEVLFIANPILPSVVDIAKISNLCLKLNKDKFTNIKSLGILLNRVRNNSYELSEEEIEKIAVLPIIAKMPEEENFIRSISTKIPVVLSNPYSEASKVYGRLAAYLIGENFIDREPEIKMKFRRLPKVKLEAQPSLTETEAKESSEIVERVRVVESEAKLESKSEEKTEPQMQQIEILRPTEKIELPTGLAETGQNGIEESIKNFIPEYKRPSFWTKVKRFFSIFRR